MGGATCWSSKWVYKWLSLKTSFNLLDFASRSHCYFSLGLFYFLLKSSPRLELNLFFILILKRNIFCLTLFFRLFIEAHHKTTKEQVQKKDFEIKTDWRTSLLLGWLVLYNRKSFFMPTNYLSKQVLTLWSKSKPRRPIMRYIWMTWLCHFIHDSIENTIF